MKSISRKARKARKALVIATVLVIVLAVAGARALGDYLNRKAWEKLAIAVYPMANQHIEWTGAGYNGIYGGAEND